MSTDERFGSVSAELGRREDPHGCSPMVERATMPEQGGRFIGTAPARETTGTLRLFLTVCPGRFGHRRSDVGTSGCSASEDGGEPGGDCRGVLARSSEELGVCFLDLRLGLTKKRTARSGKNTTLSALIFIAC